jgi:L-rhamnono-1,4-lactonase
VPWAPIICGAEILEKYIARVEEEAGEAWPKIKGFRYLLQDKPHGTMLEDKFIEGLKYLGKRGFVFEVAIDQHRRGRKQLEETVEMIGRAHEGVPDEEKVTFIISESLPQYYILYACYTTNTK